jgi:hypothetical protein
MTTTSFLFFFSCASFEIKYLCSLSTYELLRLHRLYSSSLVACTRLRSLPLSANPAPPRGSSGADWEEEEGGWGGLPKERVFSICLLAQTTHLHSDVRHCYIVDNFRKLMCRHHRCVNVSRAHRNRSGCTNCIAISHSSNVGICYTDCIAVGT